MTFFDFKGSTLAEFAKLEYKSKSHTFNKAVVASYYNVAKYGYKLRDYSSFSIKQTRREVHFHFTDYPVESCSSVKWLHLSEHAIFPKKTREVCYDLEKLFSERSTAIKRGIKFIGRKEIKIEDYKKDLRLIVLYDRWKKAKEDNPKTFLMAFNPARYLRTYDLQEAGFNIYQKIVLVNNSPYAVINFSIDGDYAYELSFLSLFNDKSVKIINDQNDCIIIHCLYDLWKNYKIKYVNLGTAAGIKGLKFFKSKLPNFDQIVYST